MSLSKRLLTFALLAGAPLAIGQQNAKATVHLRIVTVHGQALPYNATISKFKLLGTKQDFSGRFVPERETLPKHEFYTAQNVPYGRYELTAFAEHFASASRTVRVSQPDVWVVLSLRPGDATSVSASFKDDASDENMKLRFWEIKGVVVHEAVSEHRVWLRLSGAYSNVIMDAKADSSGAFTMSVVDPDDYILTTIVDDTIVDTRPVRTPLAEPLRIDLAIHPHAGGADKQYQRQSFSY